LPIALSVHACSQSNTATPQASYRVATSQTPTASSWSLAPFLAKGDSVLMLSTASSSVDHCWRHASLGHHQHHAQATFSSTCTTKGLRKPNVNSRHGYMLWVRVFCLPTAAGVGFLHTCSHGCGFLRGSRNPTHTPTPYTHGKNPRGLPIPVHITTLDHYRCFCNF
jgi:hypothetical protein